MVERKKRSLFFLLLVLIYENAHYSYVLKEIFTFYLHKSYSLHLPKVYPFLLKVAFTWSLGVTIFKCLCNINLKLVRVDTSNHCFASFSEEHKAVAFQNNIFIPVKNGGYSLTGFCEIIFFSVMKKLSICGINAGILSLVSISSASCLEINLGNILNFLKIPPLALYFQHKDSGSYCCKTRVCHVFGQAAKV